MGASDSVFGCASPSKCRGAVPGGQPSSQAPFPGATSRHFADNVWRVRLYRYGDNRWMKKTLHIDEATLRDAKNACGAVTDTETVRLGLEALSGMRRMRDCEGSEVPMRTRKTFRGAGQRAARKERQPDDLVDTSVRIRFFRDRMPYAAELGRLLVREEAAGHDLVFGELLIGDSGGRSQLLSSYDLIYRVSPVDHADVATFVRSHQLHGKGIGWIDAQLLASALVAGTSLWTADEHLAGQRTWNRIRVSPPIMWQSSDGTMVLALPSHS